MKNIKNKLSIATCTLLTGGLQQAQAIENSWDLDSSFLYYREDDDRVTVNKAIAILSGDLSDTDSVTVNLVLDTMSGSTPTGAVYSKVSSVNTFSSASGASSNTSAGESVDIAKFNDARLSISLDWAHSLDRLKTIKYGGSLSVEKDYQSYGASVTLNQDSEDRIITYTAGLAASYDQIYTKNGGTPGPLSNIEDNITFGDGERYTYDGILGISKVINRTTVAQINYTMGYSTGYHTDPYKAISLVRLVADSDSNSFVLREVERYFESRPETRQRNAIFTSLAHQYGERDDIIHLSYRYYWDDWDVTGHTIDFTHRRLLQNERYIEPHIRLHTQTAANFFMHSILDDGSPLPDFASADYRLDTTTGVTLGIEYGRPLSGGKLRARLERIDWQYDHAEYNETQATVFQISYQKLFD